MIQLSFNLPYIVFSFWSNINSSFLTLKDDHFWNDGERHSTDPLPSKTIIIGENYIQKNCKYLEVVPGFKTNEETFMQENVLRTIDL